ncbi:serine/threonine-protein kinase PINK1, mitochondrial [Lates calcarifer]|uniref:Serine/threonine-protein kinase PINK1, mitochondrial n=1 Tax=Lates calcarifer TaxID=8187 RepID=A0A4W6EB90_LATCA|nr:serine/threonine-protein kinase PINK1, mitochondrial [Lates calcarifer]XP_018540745.1 serine/threonine-protein kinase PINK1, mitochondrial [Lates calcarifer]
MSVKHAISRGLELGRSVFQLGLLKSGGRVAARLRADRFRVGPSVRTVQPQAFLPSRYRYYRTSLKGLAAQLQSAGFRRGFTGGSPRNRAVFLAFGLGVGLIEQQLEDDRRSAATCQEIQAVFSKKRFQSPLKPFTSGHKLEDYIIGNQIGKGSNAAVYEAAAQLAPPNESERKCSLVQLREDEEEGEKARSLTCCSLRNFPLAIKMMWNFGAGSSSEDILKSMSQELVPAGPLALKQEKEQITLDGQFGVLPKRVSAHPNVIRVYRAFTADVPLLPGAQEEYPDVLPARLNPAGLGNNRTLFLVMKNYPCTLRQYLEVSTPGRRQGTLMVLQLLEGVDHLCRQGIAHRDLKSDNVLLEFDSDGCPRLVITDFGCCLAQSDSSLQLPFNSIWVNRGGNASLMAPEVVTAVPGCGAVIDYSKADAWAVGAISYEIFGQHNPFYRAVGLESRTYQEKQLPSLPSSVPADVQLVIRLLLRRNPSKRPSARVAANMLHLSLWGRKALANQDSAGMRKLADWLLCQSAVVLLKGCSGPSGNKVEAELQRSFLANLDLEDLRTAVGFLLYGRDQRQACILSA